MRHVVCTLLLALSLVVAPLARAAEVNPPEVKDAAPETRENVQEKGKGVIRPPANVDPNLKTNPPTEDRSRTPVIPPPQEKDGRKIEPK